MPKETVRMKRSNASFSSVIADDGDDSVEALKKHMNEQYAKTLVTIRKEAESQRESVDSDDSKSVEDWEDLYSFKPPNLKSVDKPSNSKESTKDLYSFKPPSLKPLKKPSSKINNSKKSGSKLELYVIITLSLVICGASVGMYAAMSSKLVNVGLSPPNHNVDNNQGQQNIINKRKSIVNNDILINNHNYYPDHSSPFIENMDIPVLLDLTDGTTGKDFVAALSECYGLKSQPAYIFMNNLQLVSLSL